MPTNQTFLHSTKSQEKSLEKKKKISKNGNDLFKFQKIVNKLKRPDQIGTQIREELQGVDLELQRVPHYLEQNINTPEAELELNKLKLMTKCIQHALPWRLIISTHNLGCHQGYFPWSNKLIFVQVNTHYSNTSKEHKVDVSYAIMYNKKFVTQSNFGSARCPLFSMNHIKTPGLVQQRVDEKMTKIYNLLRLQIRHQKLVKELRSE